MRSIWLIALAVGMSGFFCQRLSLSPEEKFTVKRVTFIGNSWQEYGIDFDTLRSEFPCTIDHVWEPGEMTAWMYAQLCQCSHWNPAPDYVIITFGLYILTYPDFIVSGDYWNKIVALTKNDTSVLDTIQSVLDQSKNISDRWDFTGSVAYTFLPRMVSVAKNANIKLLLTKMRTLQDARTPLWENDAEKKYVRDLTDYCDSHGVILLDYAHDPECSSSDFLDDYHLNSMGKEKWTRLIGDDLKNCFRSLQAFHQLTGASGSTPLELQSPVPDILLQAGHPQFFSAVASDKIKWSIWMDDSSSSEIYIGTGLHCTCSLSPSQQPRELIHIMAYNGKRKVEIADTLGTDTARNLPPVADAGPDIVCYAGDSVLLKGTAYDDHKTPTLRCSWKVIYGIGNIRNPDSATATIYCPYPELVIVQFTADDGEYSSSDNMVLTCNNGNSFQITSPGISEYFSPGDTVLVKWTASGIVENCVISYSFDGGKSFSDILDAALTRSDSSWGHYNWVIPLDAPQTRSAELKLCTYDKTISTLSPMFSIIQK